MAIIRQNVNSTSIVDGSVSSADLASIIDLSSKTVTYGNLPAANLTGTLPAIDGSALTGIESLPTAISVDGSAPDNSLNINSSGNVGIGTSSPDEKLHINGNIKLQDRAKIISGDSNRGNLQISAPYSTSGVILRGISFGNNLALINDPNEWEQPATTIGGAALVLTGTNSNYGEFIFYAAQDQDIATSVVERMRLDTSGNLLFNSGYGSVATAYGCRAWVNFNGTGTVAIRQDGNVSSITDREVGRYTVNFTTAMPDANYSVANTGSNNPGNTNYGVGAMIDYEYLALSTSSAHICYKNNGGNYVDVVYACVQIVR